MVKRHQEFVLRYNAEADSSRPRTGMNLVLAISGRGLALSLVQYLILLVDVLITSTAPAH